MAPRKIRNKKKLTAAATSKSKCTKKKPAVIVNPFEKLDKQVSSIAILGERRDHAVQVYKESPNFDLFMRIPNLLKENPNYNFCLWRGSTELRVDTNSEPPKTFAKPTMIATLVPVGHLPPEFVAYSVKDELDIQPFSVHKLSWKNIAPRVYILSQTGKRMTKSSIKALSDDSLAMEEHLQLWTICPKKQLQRNKAGKLDIRSVNFSVLSRTDGKPIPGDYEKGGGLQDYIDTFVEEYGDELGDDHEEEVKSAIKQAFDDARNELEDQAELLKDSGYEEGLLDSIKTIKIYPRGTDQPVMDSYINKYYGRAHQML